MTNNKCHICGNLEIERYESYPCLCRVTSDCRPWERGGNLVRCRKCGTIQVLVSESWLDEIERIYNNYEVYHQGDGSEQVVFVDGIIRPRSEQIISGVVQNHVLADNGRLLDIGCGNGSFLKAFHQFKPEWRMSGSELDDHDRAVIETVPGFDTLWCCPPKEIAGKYDCISMIHLLEHIISPISFLADIRTLLSDSGIIIIEVPNFRKNPFDLVVADHATHFSPESTGFVLDEAGFEIVWKSDTWVPKEITIVARKKERTERSCLKSMENPEDIVTGILLWLKGLKDEAEVLAETGPLGIFGSSIAATWMFAELDGKISFFIDEDPSRIGRTHLGKPIISPADIPREAEVMIPAVREIKNKILNRLKMYDRPG